MDLIRMLDTDSVMDDINDLDALFGSSNPLKDFDDDGDISMQDSTDDADDEDSPSSMMSPDQKVARKQMLMEAFERVKSRNNS